MYRIGQEEKDAVARVIDSKSLFKINDKLRETYYFENELKERLGTGNALLMTSGKAALISALIGMGIGPGDEVIVPGYTYIATAISVVAAGAMPVIAEVDETLTLDPADVERKLTPRTKAVIPVHIQGFPCNMDSLCTLAKKYNLRILEDACQADGGAYHGKRLGTIGDAGALSFNQFKIISTGEGGALLTDDRTIFERAMIYHDSSAIAYFGEQLRDITEEQFCGTEFRTNEITAAILREQLKKLDGILHDLRRNKKIVMDALAGIYDFTPSNDIDGDCGTTLSFRFDTAEEAECFEKSEGIHALRPIDTGKHVYKHWTAIMNRRGAFNPLMDPFKMEANRDIIPDYREDMCPTTLIELARNVFINVSPDWDEQRISSLIESCINAKR